MDEINRDESEIQDYFGMEFPAYVCVECGELVTAPNHVCQDDDEGSEVA